ncbi:MAG: aspartate/glutamate racemase family protein [Promethearchaeota archaeon]|jgi:aspartate racemase
MSGRRGSSKVRRIGILGGMSYESTIKYYELILQKYYEKYRDYSYPEVIIFSLNFQKVIDYERGDKKTMYIEYLMSGIKSLESAGADFIIMAANSPHAVYEDLEELSDLPILNIVKATIEKAIKENMKTLLLLGIKFTMQSTFYQDYSKKLGIKVITPSKQEQDEIDTIIFNELVIGLNKKESQNRIIEIINSYDTDGVILGCTELPLILNQKDTNIKLLDTIELHVEAAFNNYLSLH